MSQVGFSPPVRTGPSHPISTLAPLPSKAGKDFTPLPKLGINQEGKKEGQNSALHTSPSRLLDDLSLICHRFIEYLLCAGVILSDLLLGCRPLVESALYFSFK